jgi:hypothetical protein
VVVIHHFPGLGRCPNHRTHRTGIDQSQALALSIHRSGWTKWACERTPTTSDKIDENSLSQRTRWKLLTPDFTCSTDDLTTRLVASGPGW